MNRTRAQAFAKAAEHIDANSAVAIVGHMSRTWYRDRPVLYELVDWVAECGSRAWALFNQPLIKMCADVVPCFTGTKIHALTIYEDDSVEAGMILDERHASLCIVLASRVSEDLDASSPLVARARNAKIPVLAVYASGDAHFWSNDG